MTFPIVVTSMEQLVNSSNNLVDIYIRLVARLFQQCNNIVTTLCRQPYNIFVVSHLLEQPCNKSDNAIKLVASC